MLRRAVADLLEAGSELGLDIIIASLRVVMILGVLLGISYGLLLEYLFRFIDRNVFTIAERFGDLSDDISLEHAESSHDIPGFFGVDAFFLVAVIDLPDHSHDLFLGGTFI